MGGVCLKPGLRRRDADRTPKRASAAPSGQPSRSLPAPLRPLRRDGSRATRAPIGHRDERGTRRAAVAHIQRCRQTPPRLESMPRQTVPARYNRAPTQDPTPQRGDPCLTPRPERPAAGAPSPRRRTRRGHPGPQLPASRSAGRRRPHRRLPGAGTDRTEGRAQRHPLLRRALHGRDRLHPLAAEDGAHAGQARGLPDGRHGHRGRPAQAQGRAPRRRRRRLREHLGRHQGRDGRVLHQRQRRRDRRALPPRPADHLRPGPQPRRLHREEDRARGRR